MRNSFVQARYYVYRPKSAGRVRALARVSVLCDVVWAMFGIYLWFDYFLRRLRWVRRVRGTLFVWLSAGL